MERKRMELLLQMSTPKSLELYLDQSARPVWVHPQLDKLSQGWILSLPGHNGFTQAELRETMAKLLCLPSPCCQHRVGEPLDQHGLHIDIFGDNIMSVRLLVTWSRPPSTVSA